MKSVKLTYMATCYNVHPIIRSRSKSELQSVSVTHHLKLLGNKNLLTDMSGQQRADPATWPGPRHQLRLTEGRQVNTSTNLRILITVRVRETRIGWEPGA